MTKRLALTPAVGLFAGLSVVSYGAVSMLLTGVHGNRQASTNPCTSSVTASATATTKALVRTGARAHPAGMPVLLADAVRLAPASTPGAAQGSNLLAGSTMSAGQAASQSPSASQSSPPPLPGTQPSQSASPPPLPQPSPGISATPGAGGLPQPAPATTTSSKAPLTPGGTLKSPIATPTATATATPTTTSTPTPPPGTLCLTMQTLNNVSAVDPHTTVGYAIWVWLTSGTGGTAKITLSAKPSSVSPTFSVCVPSGKSKCTVSGLNAGQKVELQAELAAPDRPSKHVTLTATATSLQASNSATASATVDIKPKNPSPSSSPTPGAGDGGTLPLAAGLPSGVTVPGLGPTPSGDLGSAFPQVSPSASAPGTTTAQHGHTARTIDVSAGLPLTVRLIGGQIIGLAVLAAAVTIAVARLSLRRQPPRHGDNSPSA